MKSLTKGESNDVRNAPDEIKNQIKNSVSLPAKDLSKQHKIWINLMLFTIGQLE